MAKSVNEIILKQEQNATDAITQGQDFLNTLTELTDVDFSDVTAPTLWNYTIFDKSEAALGEAKSAKPTAPEIPELAIELPADVNIGDVTVGTVTIPTFSASNPAINIPTTPTVSLPNEPSAPEVTDPTLPEKPTITYPDVPTLNSITLPDAPTISFDDFSETLPSDLDSLTEPTNNFAFTEDAYSNTVDASVAGHLGSDLTGGYGIETSDEAALWNRMQEREQEGSLGLTTDIIEKEAQRGLKRPSGAMFASIDKAREVALEKISSANRDIALKRSDLYVQNRQHAIQQAVQYSSMHLNYHSSKMERKLNAAKILVQLGIEVFKAKIELGKARLMKYQSAADVYKAVIQAELAKIEVYKVQMESAKIESDIQRLQVAIYEARLEAVKSIVDVYNVEMEGAKLQADIQSLKIEIYRAQIQAYAEQVRASTASFELYEAQVKGETAKVQVYESQVAAYNAKIGGVRAKADIKIAEANVKLRNNELKLQQYSTKVGASREKLQADVANVNALISQYGAENQSYSAYLSALADLYRLNGNTAEANARTAVEASRVSVRKGELELAKLSEEAKIKLHAASEGAGLFANLIAGALSAVNTVAAQIETSEAE